MPTTKTKKLKPLGKLRQKKLHTLLAVALRDVAKQERARNSVVNMNYWCEWNGECVACAAGSVMRFTLGVTRQVCKANPNLYCGPDPLDFDKETAKRLYAIDFLRLGFVASAAMRLGIKLPKKFPRQVEVAGYYSSGDNNKQRWADMRALHKRLKAVGV